MGIGPTPEEQQEYAAGRAIGRHDAHDFAARIELYAVLGARNSRANDDSDFMRIWATARTYRGLPSDAAEWEEARR